MRDLSQSLDDRVLEIRVARLVEELGELAGGEFTARSSQSVHHKNGSGVLARS